MMLNMSRDSQALMNMSLTGSTSSMMSTSTSMPNLQSNPPPLCINSMLHSKVNPRVVLATHKYWWCSGEKARALAGITDYINSLESQSSFNNFTEKSNKDNHGPMGKGDPIVPSNLFAGDN